MSFYKGNYIDDGIPVRNFNLRANPNRMLSYKRMRILLNRLDARGKRIPFTIRFVSQKDGQLIEWRNVVCTSRNPKKRTHTFFTTWHTWHGMPLPYSTSNSKKIRHTNYMLL